MNNLTEIQKAQIAMALDCEGTITTHRGGGNSFSCSVFISNTNEKIKLARNK